MSEPMGAVGQAADRDASGRFVRGNRRGWSSASAGMALLAGCRDARRDIVAAVLTDLGHTVAEAPKALLLAADGLRLDHSRVARVLG
jgi:hypothetical protein